MFNQVVFENPQIFLVVNGHSSEKGYGTTVRMARNRIGKDVIQMCCDFQKEGGHETKTGVSWIKLITFEMGKNNIHFQTYDPSSNSYIQPMVNNQPTRQEFNIPMDFASRFAL